MTYLSWSSRSRRKGKVGKEDFRGLPVCNGLNKTMPLIHPIGAVAAATFFMPVLTGDREITRVLPSQGMTQGLPEARVEEAFFHRHEKRRGVIFSCPSGAFAVRSHKVCGYPVRPVHVIASCDGFGDCLCDGQRWTSG